MYELLLEHSRIPGTVYENRLIIGGPTAILNEMDLHEGVEEHGKGVVKFRGKFQEADAINKNKRSYPFNILDENVKKLLETIKQGGLIGELDHPTDSIIHFMNASHKITKLWWEGKVLMGEGIILNTPSGKVLKALINDGVRIGISSRGVGNGKVNEEGILEIGESYKLITFDAVADPSTHAAFQEKISNTKKENTNFTTKNEVNSINTIDKNLLIACLGGIIKKEINIIKEGLN